MSGSGPEMLYYFIFNLSVCYQGTLVLSYHMVNSFDMKLESREQYVCVGSEFIKRPKMSKKGSGIYFRGSTTCCCLGKGTVLGIRDPTTHCCWGRII